MDSLFLCTSGPRKWAKIAVPLPSLLPKPQETCPCAVVLDMPISPASPDEAAEGNLPWLCHMPAEWCDSSTWVPIILLIYCRVLPSLQMNTGQREGIQYCLSCSLAGSFILPTAWILSGNWREETLMFARNGGEILMLCLIYIFIRHTSTKCPSALSCTSGVMDALPCFPWWVKWLRWW